MSDSEEDSAPAVESPSLASTRSRRDNAGKRKAPAGKFAALQKLREAREQGRKMNYEVEEVQNVYDVVDENEFYVALSVYYSSLTFGGQNFYTGSTHTLFTAYYNNGSWLWVDQDTFSSGGYAYGKVAFMGTDDSKNFYVVTTNGASGSWTEYSISSYSPNGTNWVRTLETPYQSPTYNYIPPLFDIDSNGFHAFLTVPNQIKYDSQTVNCPTYGEEGVCHLWLSVNQAGVKTSAVGSAYTSIQFNRMSIHNGSVYLSGNTYDRVVGSHTESNFTGQKISHSPRYANYVAVMESDGSWGYHLAVNQMQNNLYQYGYITDVLDDGTLLFNGIYVESVSVDGTIVTAYESSDAEAILLRISPESGLIWSRSIGFNNPNAYPLDMYSDGDTVAFHVAVSSNGDISYDSGLSRPMKIRVMMRITCFGLMLQTGKLWTLSPLRQQVYLDGRMMVA